MEKTVESFICDGCEKELIQDTPYPHRWGLTLGNSDFNRNSGSMTYSVMDYAILQHNKHFCNLKCLKEWVDKQECS